MKCTSLPLQAARVHHAARRRGGGVAARGARAAGRRMRRIGVLMASAADEPESQARIAAFCKGLHAIGLDRRPQRADRIPLGRRANADDFADTAAELVALAPDVIVAATGTATVAPLLQATRTLPIVFAMSSIRSAPVSSRAWHGRAATPPVSHVRIRPEREMAGTAQADRAGRHASGGRAGPGHRLRDRTVRGHPGRGAGLGVDLSSGRRARCARDRARRHGIRALRQWRPDRDAERGCAASSRSDRRAGGPAPIARRILPPASTSPPAA